MDHSVVVLTKTDLWLTEVFVIVNKTITTLMIHCVQAEKQRAELQRELELLAERLQEAGGVSQAQVAMAFYTT